MRVNDVSPLLGWDGRPRPLDAQRHLLQAQRPAATETVDFLREQPLDTAPEKTGPTRGERIFGSFSADVKPFTPSSRLLLAAYRGAHLFIDSPTVRGSAGVATCITAMCVLVAVGAPSVAAEVDWADVEKQATEFLSTYVQIDTTNPPGNEAAAAQFLAGHFRKAGIDAETFESAPGRGSVLARLKGSGGGRPVILLNHLDVVPANSDGWDVPPFSGAVRDGYVYGRGALDCKGVGTVDAMALLLMKQHGITLKRDVIFLGTADEETGGKLGAGWMVDTHFDRFADAQFVLNEGGAIEILPDGKRAYGVAVAEKTPCWLRLTATGRPGHGSAPDKHTAVTRLVRALERTRVYRPALRVTPEVQAYYAAIAPLQDDTRRKQYTNLRLALQDDATVYHLRQVKSFSFASMSVPD